ncbi:MAG: helix-turn-helix domain-containing protein [Verrucomicrobia bacterium]|nr:helix-turn-helix domain-containing protein [Verrucomicrobiota bacterium]MCH8511845.1 helix-turn-helix domain-containing protein [Kiritimatiellia bacterium]
MNPSPVFRVLIALELTEAYAQSILRGVCRRGGLEPRLRLHTVRLFPSEVLPQRLAHCDGVIASIVNQEVAEILRSRKIPLINVSNRGTSFHPVSVVSDLQGAFARGLQHFQERGLAHVATLGKSEKDAVLPEEFREAFTFHGCVPFGDGMRLMDDKTVKKVGAWLKRVPHPLGVFCTSDGLAVNLSEICERNGLRVPEEVAIMGTGNDEVRALTNRPTLSSVEMNFDEVGCQSVQVLLDLLEGNTPNPPIRVVPTGPVVVRQSSNIYAVPDPYVAKALKLMDAHLAESLDIGNLAEMLHISRRMFEHRFQDQMGMPPAGYLRAKRLRHAAEMLENSDLQITEIAYATGFANAAHFCTLFRKHHGKSPKQFRAKLNDE